MQSRNWISSPYVSFVVLAVATGVLALAIPRWFDGESSATATVEEPKLHVPDVQVQAAASAIASSSESTPEPTQVPRNETVEEAPPPPPLGLTFLGRDGLIVLLPFDTRPIPDEERALDPWVRPGWDELVECVREGGFDAGIPDDIRITWTEVTELVEYVNSFGPSSYREEKTGGLVYAPTRAAEVFIDCHIEHVGGP
jgi:hypothetical protein